MRKTVISVEYNDKGTYAYDKLIDCLCHMVADKEFEAFVVGGDWKLPVVEGLQPANFIQNQEFSNSMDASGFEREYKFITVLYKYNKLLETPICDIIGQSAA